MRNLLTAFGMLVLLGLLACAAIGGLLWYCSVHNCFI